MTTHRVWVGATAAPNSRTAHEERVQRIGRELFARCHRQQPRVLQGDWWQQRMLEWAMHDDHLRTQLFRFIDVLPALSTNAQVAAHLSEYLFREPDTLPPPLRATLSFSSLESLAARIAAIGARRQVRSLAHRFIVGESVADALTTIEQLRTRHMAFTLDVLGEAVTSEVQADAYTRHYVRLIEELAQTAREWPVDTQIDHGPHGLLPRVNVSLKLSALFSNFDPIAPSRAHAVAGTRLRAILRAAQKHHAFVNIDMEEYAHKDLVLDIFQSVLLEDEFRDCVDVGVVLQAYLQDAEHDLQRLADWVQRRARPITVRLVKGAYWDLETIVAAQRGWPRPVFTHKWETDAAFERLTARLMDNHELLHPAIASHNVRSLANAIALAEEQGLGPASDFEVQMLFGMGDALKAAVVELGLRLRVYSPYGRLIPGMGYLIRRLLENTSNDSFLRQSFTEGVSIDELLADPSAAHGEVPPSARACNPASASDSTSEGLAAFRSEPLSDFRLSRQRDAMAAGLRDVRRQAGGTHPLMIDGHVESSPRMLESVDPSSASFLVGRVACASVEQAERAVAAAQRAWPAWASTAVEKRCALLQEVAERLRRRRFEFAAWIIIEAGKPWRDADAEVAEAIDYCEYYAVQMMRLHQHTYRRDVPGEHNWMVHEPRGVAAIIAPWNFPLAILTGMMAAALVTGNTVVAKPAEQTPVIAAQLFSVLQDAGLPPGVGNLVPGFGDDVGARLVAHPQVDLIAFTGSKAVGLKIIESAAHLAPGQRSIKRVVAEMGGKNAIIIDADADLDEAVRGVVASAFGYAGQKCSACSRVIVLESLHEMFVQRLVDSVRSLSIGPADDPATIVGPVIDAEACDGVRRFIDIGKREATLVCEIECQIRGGSFVGPVVFDHVLPQSVLGQEEIFGPVLSVMTAPSFEAALAIANDTGYALTGGVYTRQPSHIRCARSSFRVGNLYIGRPITGALVGRQPFGGRKHSGVGSKAGGPEYLQQFCEAKTISENIMRHGFAPTES